MQIVGVSYKFYEEIILVRWYLISYVFMKENTYAARLLLRLVWPKQLSVFKLGIFHFHKPPFIIRRDRDWLFFSILLPSKKPLNMDDTRCFLKLKTQKHLSALFYILRYERSLNWNWKYIYDLKISCPEFNLSQKQLGKTLFRLTLYYVKSVTRISNNTHWNLYCKTN